MRQANSLLCQVAVGPRMPRAARSSVKPIAAEEAIITIYLRLS